MKSYVKTDKQLHQLCQTLAKANRTFVPKKEDDSHTNLYFDAVGNRITGRWIEAEEKKFLFTFNLENLHYEILNNAQQVVKSFPSVGSKIVEIEESIYQFLPDLGLSKSNFLEALHFEIPEYSLANQVIPEIAAKDISDWKSFRELANEACLTLLGHTQVWEEIRIWPHHFDTGIYIKIKADLGLGFGLAMEDEMVGAPYFYLAGYPENKAINYENLPEGKGWEWKIGEHWNGAVLPIDQLHNKMKSQQLDLLNSYLTSAFSWFVKQ